MPEIKMQEFVNEDDSLLFEPYYFDTISLEEATNILNAVKKEGAFILRKRTGNDTQSLPFALDIYYDSIVHHTRITRDPSGQFKFGESKDSKSKFFNSVQELIKFLDGNQNFKLTLKHCNSLNWYKKTPKVSKIKKSYPTESKEVQDSEQCLTDLSYFLRNKTKESIENLLNKIKENGVFFIHNSNDAEADRKPYELLVYNKPHVYALKISKSIYDNYSIENNDLNFVSIAEMVKHFNYEQLKLTKTGPSINLKIYYRYIRDEDV